MGVNNECPPSCCTGDEILCVGIPCPIDIVLLGLELTVELPCIRVSSNGELTDDQIQRLIGVLEGVLGNLNGLFGTEE